MTKNLCTRVVLCTKYKISCLKYIFITSVPKKQEHFTNELWSFYATRVGEKDTNSRYTNLTQGFPDPLSKVVGRLHLNSELENNQS